MKTLALLAAGALTALGYPHAMDQDPNKETAGKPETIRVLDIGEEVAKHRKAKHSYSRILKVPALSCGIYSLPKGGRDGQSPHQEDEIYYVLKGKAKISQKGRADRAVKKGSLIYVKADADHRFTGIEEDLELLVFFSSAPSDPPASKGK